MRVNLKEMINITVQTAMCLIEMIERNKQLVIDKFNGAKSNDETRELSWNDIRELINTSDRYLKILKKSMNYAEFDFHGE